MLKLAERMETFSKQVDEVISTSHEGIPEWAKLMVTCFKGIINELKGFCEHSVQGASSLEDIPELQRTTAVYHSTIDINGSKGVTELRHDVDNLLNENKRLECEISKVKNKIEKQELRRRNYDLLLYKMDDPTKKRIDEIIKVIHTDIKGKIPRSPVPPIQPSQLSEEQPKLSEGETKLAEGEQKLPLKPDSVSDMASDHKLLHSGGGTDPHLPLPRKETVTDNMEPIVFYNEDNEFAYKNE